MTHPLQERREAGPWLALFFSIAIHLALGLILQKTHLTSATFREEPVYYVDVVNLPVANPQMGSPTVDAGTPPPPEPAPRQPEMAQPQKKAEQAPKSAKTAKPEPTARKPVAEESGKEFEERLAKLERKAEASYQESAVDALRRKMAGSGKSAPALGMPKGSGSAAGSDYAQYIQSRLRDAFEQTNTSNNNQLEVTVRLAIGKDGRITRQKVEKGSSDRLFETGVFSAIARAEKSFRPPPDGREVEYLFIFRPQGVSKK